MAGVECMMERSNANVIQVVKIMMIVVLTMTKSVVSENLLLLIVLQLWTFCESFLTP